MKLALGSQKISRKMSKKPQNELKRNKFLFDISTVMAWWEAEDDYLLIFIQTYSTKVERIALEQ